jgi:hypothetical protein
MPTDDEAARKARAERLRAQVNAAKRRRADQAPETAAPEQPADKPGEGESPREFVHRRMRELRDEEAES